MKEMTKFVSGDGIEFKSKSECENYEDFYKKLKRLKKQIPKEPKYISFANGKGYLQWTPELFNKVKNTVLDWGYEITDDMVYLEAKQLPYCRGIVGRYIGDSSNPKIRRIKNIWWRLMNIDNKYREWGQGYFALHPERAEHIRLN